MSTHKTTSALNVVSWTYFNDTAVNAVVRVPQASVISPLPDGALCSLGTSFLKHCINRKDALSGQTRHQLTTAER